MNPFPMTPIIDVEGKTITMIDAYGDEWQVLGSIKDDGIKHIPAFEQEKMTSWKTSEKIMVSIGAASSINARPSSLDMAIPDADPGDAPCPHCGRARHEAPLTESMWKMFSTRGFDPYYLSAEDRSPVLCGGSSFIGPMPDEEFWQEKTHPPVSVSKGEWIIPAGESLKINFETWLGPLKDPFEHIQPVGAYQQQPYSFYDEAWNLINPSVPKCLEQPAPDVDVTFGPHNWWCEFWPAVFKTVHWTWGVGGEPWKLHYEPTLISAVEKVWHTAANQVTIPMTPPKMDWQKMFPKENTYPTTKGFTS